jgi:hypothetical protein
MHATVFEPAAAQVGAELAGDEGGEPVAAALVGGAGQEGLEMALEGAVEDRVLGSMALIARGRTDQGHEPGPGAAAMPGRSGGGGVREITGLVMGRGVAADARVPTLLGAGPSLGAVGGPEERLKSRSMRADRIVWTVVGT